MDGPSAQGFLSLTGPLAPRVVVAASPQFKKRDRIPSGEARLLGFIIRGRLL